MKPQSFSLQFSALLGVILCLASSGACAQGVWEWQNPTPSGSTLHDVDVLAPGVAVAVGNNATVMRTRDSGKSWWFYPSKAYDNLFTITFLNEQVGLRGGTRGIYRTGNGGDTWEETSVKEPHIFIDDIHILDERNAAAVGGTIRPTCSALRSTDGGVTWLYGNTPDLAISLHGVYYLDSLHGWAVGSSGTILRTTDAGQNWTTHLDGSAGWGNVKLHAIAFGDAVTGVIVGENGTLLRTTDGGETWSKEELGITLPLHDVRFTNPTTAVVAGQRWIFRSEDGGKTWAGNNGGHYLYGAAFSGNWGIAVGLSGKIVTSADGGDSWKEETRSILGNRLFDVDFLDRDHGVTVGDFGTTVYTTDGGKTWTRNALTGMSGKLTKVVYAGSDTIYGLGEKGLFIRSVDGGKTWITRTGLSGRLLNDIAFSDTRHGMIVGQGIILTTSDAGLSWHTDTTSAWPILWGVGMADSLHAVAAGRNGAIYRTADGGLTWESVTTDYTATLNYVQMVDSENAVLGHPAGIIRTTDGGSTWSAYDAPEGAHFYKVSFVDPLTGWIAGEQGIVYQTTDGGETWTPLHHNITNFDGGNGAMYSLSFPDRSGGWVVGHWGTIVRYHADESLSVGTNTVHSRFLHGLRLQPNPAAESITVDVNGISGTNLTARLYNVLGQELLSERIDRTELTPVGWELSVSALPDGFYYIDVRNERGEGLGGSVIVRR